MQVPIDATHDVQKSIRDIIDQIETLKRSLSASPNSVSRADLDALRAQVQDVKAKPTFLDFNDVFRGSGPAHAIGYVPDAGATPGTTRYLREDGTWQTISIPVANPSVVKNVNPQTAGYGSTTNRPLVAYNFPTGVLAVGDAIHVFARLRATAATFKSITVYLNAAGYVAGTGTNAWGAPSLMDVRAIFGLNSLTEAYGTLMGYDYTDLKLNSSTNITLPNVYTGGLTVAVYGSSSGGSNDIVLDQVTILHYKTVA